MTTSHDEASTGRVAIVTGGSRGAGRATVRRLVSRGYAVVVDYLHDQRAAEATVEAVLAGNGAAVAVRADVADDVDVTRLFDEAIEAFGGVDVVVHTVGSRTSPAPTLIVNREAARRLRAGGAIVNLTSSAAPLPNHENHAATTATEVLIRTLALELRERDITVNGVALAVDGPCAPNRIADAVAYLVSDDGHGLTGRMIRIDEFEALNRRRSPEPPTRR
jgi:3-oxoacyl-[acyl-carrier protein] reductase